MYNFGRGRDRVRTITDGCLYGPLSHQLESGETISFGGVMGSRLRETVRRVIGMYVALKDERLGDWGMRGSIKRETDKEESKEEEQNPEGFHSTR